MPVRDAGEYLDAAVFTNLRRDHEFLNWRFVDAPSGRFRAHGAFDAGGHLRG